MFTPIIFPKHLKVLRIKSPLLVEIKLRFCSVNSRKRTVLCQLREYTHCILRESVHSPIIYK